MKNLVYLKEGKNPDSHERCITDAFASIKEEILQFVTDKFVTRLCYCITSEGYHIENLAH